MEYTLLEVLKRRLYPVVLAMISPMAKIISQTNHGKNTLSSCSRYDITQKPYWCSHHDVCQHDIDAANCGNQKSYLKHIIRLFNQLIQYIYIIIPSVLLN